MKRVPVPASFNIGTEGECGRRLKRLPFEPASRSAPRAVVLEALAGRPLESRSGRAWVPGEDPGNVRLTFVERGAAAL